LASAVPPIDTSCGAGFAAHDIVGQRSREAE
jgi:hypothetical protein